MNVKKNEKIQESSGSYEFSISACGMLDAHQINVNENLFTTRECCLRPQKREKKSHKSSSFPFSFRKKLSRISKPLVFFFGLPICVVEHFFFNTFAEMLNCANTQNLKF